MTLTNHRVVGLLEWPAGLEIAPALLQSLPSELLPGRTTTPGKVLSLRVPVAEIYTEQLSTNLSQLRLDLESLFAELTENAV
jgi:hypothetical protein